MIESLIRTQQGCSKVFRSRLVADLFRRKEDYVIKAPEVFLREQGGC